MPPPTLSQPSATGGLSQAVITFTQPEGEGLYYEAAVVSPGGADAGRPATVSCHPGVSPPDCAELCDAGGSTMALTVPLSALNNAPGRYAFKLRALNAADGTPGGWSPASAAVAVGPPTGVSDIVATGAAGGATLTFAPGMRADGGYLIEVLDEHDAVVGTATVTARQLLEQSCSAVPVSRVAGGLQVLARLRSQFTDATAPSCCLPDLPRSATLRAGQGRRACSASAPVIQPKVAAAHVAVFHWLLLADSQLPA